MVIRDVPHFQRGYFYLGETVKIIPILYEKDTILVHESNRDRLPYFEEVVAPKGSIKTFHIRNSKGMEYSREQLINLIGYKPLSYFLDKI